MQSDINDKSQLDTATDEELIDVLITISVVSKRLASSLEQLNLRQH
jgi:hypothetical protein